MKWRIWQEGDEAPEEDFPEYEARSAEEAAIRWAEEWLADDDEPQQATLCCKPLGIETVRVTYVMAPSFTTRRVVDV